MIIISMISTRQVPEAGDGGGDGAWDQVRDDAEGPGGHVRVGLRLLQDVCQVQPDHR